MAAASFTSDPINTALAEQAKALLTKGTGKATKSTRYFHGSERARRTCERIVFDRIFPHDHCTDGLSAAFVFSEVFPNAKIVGIKPQETCVAVEDLQDLNIVLVDQCFDLEKTKEALQLCKNMHIVDHHESTEEIVDKLVEWVRETPERERELLPKLAYSLNIDKTMSGVGLAWSECHPSMELPVVFRYIQDNDLGLRQMVHSEQIIAAVYQDKYQNFDQMRKWSQPAGRDKTRALIRELREEGVPILQAQKERDDALSLKAKKMRFIHQDFSHLTVAVVESESPGRFAKLCDRLPVDHEVDVGLVTWPTADGWGLSLRRREEKTVNLNMLAKTVFSKGGGHPGASGGTIFASRGETLASFLVAVQHQ